MDHSIAQEIFEEIQARPYNVSVEAGEPSNNCYFKGIELLQKLGILGYTVRGRVGETYWDEKVFGEEITSLIPTDLKTTHFFTEIFIDDDWRIIDPSFQPSLKKYGLSIGSWGGGECCFPIVKLYSQQESVAYQALWFNKEYQESFFKQGRTAWKALNQWFEGK